LYYNYLGSLDRDTSPYQNTENNLGNVTDLVNSIVKQVSDLDTQKEVFYTNEEDKFSVASHASDKTIIPVTENFVAFDDTFTKTEEIMKK